MKHFLPDFSFSRLAICLMGWLLSFHGLGEDEDRPTNKGLVDIRGSVTYQPDPQRPWRLKRYFVHGQEGRMSAAVVELVPINPKPQAHEVPPSYQTLLIDQKDHMFLPETLVMRLGDSVRLLNSEWTGTPLAPLLEQCQPDPRVTEVVFYGKDTKEETLRPGTNRELKIEVPFGRSMTLGDAMQHPLLLAYDRNGTPMEHRNGAPLRLIVPGYYGIANVKWLTRIELRDRRYMGRYMARDYVTVRAEERDGALTHVETSVGRMNLKSIIARVTRRPTQGDKIPLRAYGATWGDGTPIDRVEVQLNGGKWQKAQWDPSAQASRYCWRFFWIDLGEVPAGKHTLVSRAIDAQGRIQPSAEDDEIALKKTYWEAYQQWPRTIVIEA